MGKISKLRLSFYVEDGQAKSYVIFYFIFLFLYFSVPSWSIGGYSTGHFFCLRILIEFYMCFAVSCVSSERFVSKIVYLKGVSIVFLVL